MGQMTIWANSRMLLLLLLLPNYIPADYKYLDCPRALSFFDSLLRLRLNSTW